MSNRKEQAMDQTVIVKYQTRIEYCQCCEQKLPNTKISDIREFEFSKENLMSWTDWREVAEFEEDLDAIVQEYVYETISFFATSSGTKILIDDNEFEKVKEFILKEIVA